MATALSLVDVSNESHTWWGGKFMAVTMDLRPTKE